MNDSNEHKPFLERSRIERKLARQDIRIEIARSASLLGGLFCTDQHIHDETSWIDICFLGSADDVFYNAALQTARYEYKEEISLAAWDAADAVVPYLFDVYEDEELAATCHYGRDPRTEGELSEFGGMTRLQWISAEEARIADSRTVNVNERVDLDLNYSYGIGLHATLDVPYLSVDVINTFIRDFLANGEKAWRNENALSFSHAEIGCWGLEPNALVESNAVIEPCEA